MFTRATLSTARKVFGASIVAGTGVVVYEHRVRSDDGSILIPTLEATGRVIRLSGTFVMMVADYKLPWLTSSNTTSMEQQQQSEEYMYWEREHELRQIALEKAQERYSSKSHHHLDMKGRLEAKKHEKEEMKHAAELLAEADEKLAQLGGTNKSRIHKQAAERLLELCQTNRGVYIKIGQHLANLDYLIPNEYIETLSELYDNNPRTSYDDVCRVIQEDFGKHPNEIFDSFEHEPIASASLAQVHVAYINGQKLAVKVQHRGLRETAAGDIFSLVSVVNFAEKVFDDFSFGWLADEIAPNLPKELDFQNEGKNAEKAAEHIKKTNLPCIIPKIIWDKTSSRVLTMEFEEGFKASKVDEIDKVGLKRHDVAKLISSVFASQVFDSGHVHCDPHEANVLIRKGRNNKPEMVLVDHGLYKQLDKEFQLQYAKLWKSLMLADLSGIQEACTNMGISDSDSYSLFAGILTARPFDEIVERSKTNTLSHVDNDPESKSDHVIIRGYAQQFLPNIMALLAVIPRQMLLLLKMNDCLRHIDYMLGSPTNTLIVTGQLAAKSIYNNEIRNAPTYIYQLKIWWNYFSVCVRIHIHETSLLLLNRFGFLKLSS